MKCSPELLNLMLDRESKYSHVRKELLAMRLKKLIKKAFMKEPWKEVTPREVELVLHVIASMESCTIR